VSSRAEMLAAKRRSLQLRCAIERQEIRFLHADVEARLQGADRILDIARGVVKHPLLIGATVLGVALIGPFKILRWASQSVLLWSASRRLAGYFLNRNSPTDSAQ